MLIFPLVEKKWQGKLMCSIDKEERKKDIFYIKNEFFAIIFNKFNKLFKNTG